MTDSKIPILAACIVAVCCFRVAPGAEIAVDQREIADGYERLEAAALRIADLSAEEDPVHAEQIRRAIRGARRLGMRDRFDAVVALLESQRLNAAGKGQEELADHLAELLHELLSDPNEQRLEEELRRIERLAKQLRSAIRRQRSLRGRTERTTPQESQPLADAQGELAETLEEVAERQREQGAEDPEGARSITERVESATESMRRAQRRLAGGDPSSAEGDQREAQRELESALRDAEERLKQLREEERQRRLMGLAERFGRMLAEQELLRSDTADVRGAPQGRATRLASVELSRRQAAVADDCEKAQRVVREDGKSLSFDLAIEQTLGVMRSVEGRLREARVDDATIGLQDAAVASLRAMLEAVDESLRESRESQQGAGKPGSGPAGEPSLVSRLAELRMLRGMQAHLQRQTELWDGARVSGEATPREAEEQLRRLAVEQHRLSAAAEHASDP